MDSKYILTIAVLGITVLFGSNSNVLAQSPTLPSGRPWQERVQQRIENVKERQELRVERRCDLVNARIDARIRHFNLRKDNILARQKRIKERVLAFINRLERKGYDVSRVRGDLETLGGMVQTADSDYAVFIRELEEAKQFDCGDSQGAFIKALGEARAALAKFRTDVKNIWDFIQNTLRPDLKALREQNPSSSPTQ